MLSSQERSFVMRRPVGHLGTVDSAPSPHVVPVCFALAGDAVYIPVDEKPKSGNPRDLKRLRNIQGNGNVCLMVDRYDPDWSRLGWIMIRGTANVIDTGANRQVGIDLLRGRYPEYLEMKLEERPMIVIDIELVTSWGDLSG
jgi:PPOX class probable F420-dependent enzyme